MILEKLSNKVNPKKNIYRSFWKLETDKMAGQKLGGWGWEWDREKERWGERREKGRIGESFGEWDN